MLTFICYPNCSTCQKAQALLDNHQAKYKIRDIKTDNPSYDELKDWLALSEAPVKKFFNTSGQLYKSLGLKDKLPSMSEDECLRLLATDGMLVKRPLLLDYDGVLVGFNHDEWESFLSEMASVPTTVTIDIKGNEIHFPFKWCSRFNFVAKFVQITLVDDRIAIHKPTATGATYTKPCKAGDNSYIRSMRLFSVMVPQQFLEKLGIRDGDKADLTREDNCISISRHPDEPKPTEPEQPDPIMAFCCVCGGLLYTNGLVRISSKFICPECVDAVKAL